MNRKRVILISVLIFLAAAVTISMNLESDEEAAVCGKIARMNGLAGSDVSVSISHFLSCFCDITFKKMPADGVIRIGDAVDLPKLVGLSVAVPGGDISELLSDPELTNIVKTGNVPIRCSKVINVGRALTWRIGGFSMDDLNALAGMLAKSDKLIINMAAPADGIIDWKVISRFPPVGWRFDNVTQWKNMENTTVEAKFVVVHTEQIDLPAKLKCTSFYAEKCRKIDLSRIDAGSLENISLHADIPRSEILRQFPNLKQ